LRQNLLHLSLKHYKYTNIEIYIFQLTLHRAPSHTMNHYWSLLPPIVTMVIGLTWSIPFHDWLPLLEVSRIASTDPWSSVCGTKINSILAPGTLYIYFSFGTRTNVPHIYHWAHLHSNELKLVTILSCDLVFGCHLLAYSLMPFSITNICATFHNFFATFHKYK
jgi:hypothetical protein